MASVCFHSECGKKVAIYGAIVWLRERLFICLFGFVASQSFSIQVLSIYYASALAVGVGVWQWRWHCHFFSYPFLCSWQIQRNVFVGLTADLGRKIVEKHLVLNRKLGLICSNLNETTQRSGGGAILQRKNYFLNAYWCYRGNPTVVRIILRNFYFVSTVLAMQKVNPKEYNLKKKTGVFQSIYLLGETVYPETIKTNEYYTDVFLV